MPNPNVLVTLRFLVPRTTLSSPKTMSGLCFFHRPCQSGGIKLVGETCGVANVLHYSPCYPCAGNYNDRQLAVYHAPCQTDRQALVAGLQFERTTCEGRRTEDEVELRPLSNHHRYCSSSTCLNRKKRPSRPIGDVCLQSRLCL